jgi:hypothetical protein
MNVLDPLLKVRGVENTTLWLALAATGIVCVRCIRSIVRRPTCDQSLRAVQKLLDSSLVFAFVGLGAVLTALFAIYIGYEAPRDIMQDIVSSQEMLQGRPLYPPNMTEMIQASLAREPARLSLGWVWPRLREREQDALQRAVTSPWVQAHPPLMTLLLAPFVASLGVHGTYVAFSMLSVGALLLSLTLLHREIGRKLSGRQVAILGLAVLGWGPVLTTMRNGQSGILLGALMICGWFSLRRGREVVAGVAVGAATCLKLYPGLLLLYFLLRHRRAFMAAFLTTLLLAWLPGVLTGWGTYLDYSRTARLVVTTYAGYFDNLSLLGLLTRMAQRPEGQFAMKTLFIGSGLVIVGSVAWLVRHRPDVNAGTTKALDLEYALFVALMPLLSPIAWDHYLTILLLPLAVLGQRILEPASSQGDLLGFLGLVVVLSIPQVTFHWLFASGDTIISSSPNLLLVSLPTLALAALCVWMATIHARSKGAAPSFYS